MSNMVILKGPKGVRLVQCQTPYRLLPDEQIIGSATLADAAKHIEVHEAEQMILDDVKDTIGAGDLMAKVLKETGFKDWWTKGHKGQCLPCKQRQAVANYLQFKGPKWLKRWVSESDSNSNNDTGSGS